MIAGMSSQPRFSFHVDRENGFLVVRPIGDMSGPDMAARVIEAYQSVVAPWTFGRIIDLRRHTGYVAMEDRALIANAWAEMTAGIAYHAHVAMVVRDSYERLRLPEVSAQFPNETICYFLDYHEAVGWILASEKAKYLSDLGSNAAPADAPNIVNFD